MCTGHAVTVTVTRIAGACFCGIVSFIDQRPKAEVRWPPAAIFASLYTVAGHNRLAHFDRRSKDARCQQFTCYVRAKQTAGTCRVEYYEDILLRLSLSSLLRSSDATVTVGNSILCCIVYANRTAADERRQKSFTENTTQLSYAQTRRRSSSSLWQAKIFSNVDNIHVFHSVGNEFLNITYMFFIPPEPECLLFRRLCCFTYIQYRYMAPYKWLRL